MTQAELATAARVTQSVVSAYESGRRDPTIGTLERLISATGNTLDIRVKSYESGSLLTEVLTRAEQIKSLAHSRGYTNIRVFGSVARRQETAHSDIDILVSGVRGLLQLSGLRRDLVALLGREVDIVPDYALRHEYQAQALSEAVAL
jgi:predicted nucleotidyltransferase